MWFQRWRSQDGQVSGRRLKRLIDNWCYTLPVSTIACEQYNEQFCTPLRSLTLLLQLGSNLPQTDLLNGISEPLDIKWNGLVTFPRYGWATKRHENYCPTLHRKSNMAAGYTDTHAIENLPKSGRFTKPCRNVTRHHILMQFSTVLMIRHYQLHSSTLKLHFTPHP